MSATLTSSKELFALLQKKSKDKCKFSLSSEEGHTKHFWESLIKTEAHLKLFYELMKRTLDSLIEKRYSDFDAQTTTNCCHGMAIFVRSLILETLELDLEKARLFLESSFETYENDLEGLGKEILSKLSGILIDLMSLYTLHFISEKSLLIGKKSTPSRLNLIVGVSTTFCKRVIEYLQKFFSNFIAQSYESYLDRLDTLLHMNGISIGTWGQYIRDKHIRKDYRNNRYASCLFSMQIVLSQIIQSRSCLAVLNDVFDHETQKLKRRDLYLLRGNGRDLVNIPKCEVIKLYSDGAEPLTVFAGCSTINNSNKKMESIGLESWIHNFPSLVLACDTHYPQFPKVSKDPGFDSSPIAPSEKQLNDIINFHKKIEGVTGEKPSLYCLSHIFPASLYQFLNVITGTASKDLPVCPIPYIINQKYKMQKSSTSPEKA